MKKRSESPEDWDALREKIIGLGERSVRKNYYPELQHQYAELKRFRQLLDQSSELILVFDVASLRVIDVNDTACELLERGRDHLLGAHLAEVHPAFGEVALEAIAKPGQSIPVRVVYACVNGTAHTLDGWAKVVTVDDRQTGMLIARDISDRIRAETALQESEAKYRRLYESMRDALVSVDMDGRLQEFNSTYQMMLGYSEEELRQLTYQALTPEKWHVFEAGIIKEQVLTRGYSDVYEKEYRRKNGGIFPVELRTFLMRDAANQPTGMSAIVRDITERKHAEQVLLESEQKYRELVENANCIILRWNPQGEITFMNEFGLNFFGYSAEELIGQHVLGTIVPLNESTSRDLRPLMNEICLHPEQFERNVNENIRRNGEQVWIAWTNRAVLDHWGQLVEIFSVGSDITERRRAEIALKENSAFLNTLLNAIPLPVFYKDTEGRYIGFNKAFTEFYGKQPQELVGKGVSDLAPEGLAKIYREKDLELFQHPGSQVYESQVVDAQGAVHKVIFYKATFTDSNDDVCGLIGVILDITERRRTEEELRQYREHLEELVAERTAELRQAMIQLVQSEKLAALGNLVAGVAHELNTPLGNARVVASTLDEHLREFAAAVESGTLRRSQVAQFLERGRQATELLERNTARAANLISHFKQIAVDQTSMRRRLFNLRQTVEEVLATLHPLLKHTAHQIERDIPVDLELDSYPGPLEQVLANLISNSLTHGFGNVETGCIRLSAESLSATHISLCYADNGVGISATILTRIFEPFFTTRLGQGGSGLGLYIVHNLVTGALGGTIEVHSVVGQGLGFTFILPLRAPQPQDTAITPA